jgi:hypothetical protein
MKILSAFTKPPPKPKAPKEPRRLPGEKHNFRDLTPPQHLTGDKIESSRKTEITREDPLMAKIRGLKALLSAALPHIADKHLAKKIEEYLK